MNGKFPMAHATVEGVSIDDRGVGMCHASIVSTVVSQSCRRWSVQLYSKSCNAVYGILNDQVLRRAASLSSV